MSTWPRWRTVLDEDVAGIMLTNPNTLGLFEEDIAADRRRRARGGRAPVLRRRQPQRHPGRGPPRRHGLRHRAHEPAQDLRHPPRRGRAGCRSGGRVRASRPLPARPPGACRVASDDQTPVFGWATPGTVHRPDAHLARQHPGAGPGPRLHPGQRGRRAPPRRRDGRPQRQLAPTTAARAPTTCPSTGPACTSGPLGYDAQAGHTACGPWTWPSGSSRRASTRRRCTSRSSSTRP